MDWTGTDNQYEILLAVRTAAPRFQKTTADCRGSCARLLNPVPLCLARLKRRLLLTTVNFFAAQGAFHCLYMRQPRQRQCRPMTLPKTHQQRISFWHVSRRFPVAVVFCSISSQCELASAERHRLILCAEGRWYACDASVQPSTNQCCYRLDDRRRAACFARARQLFTLEKTLHGWQHDAQASNCKS